MSDLVRRTLVLFGLSALATAPVWAGWSTNPAENDVVCSSPAAQVLPSSVTDGSGGVITAFLETSYANSSVIYHPRVQRLDRDGDPLWGEFGTELEGPAEYRVKTPVVAGDGAGGAFVGWVRSEEAPPLMGTFPQVNHVARLQRLDASGSPLWGEGGVVLNSSPAGELIPLLVGDTLGGAFAVLNHEGSYLLQRVDGQGNLLWPGMGALLSPSTSSIRNNGIQLVPDGSGGVLAIVQDSASGAIRARGINAEGNVSWGDVELDPGTGGGFRAVADGTGGAFVLWLRDQVRAQRVGSEGTILWQEGGIPLGAVSTTSGTPAIGADGQGGLHVVWTQPVSENGVQGMKAFAQRLTSTGALLWPAGGVPVNQEGNAANPSVVAGTAGGAIVTWMETPTSSTASRMMAQSFDGEGNRQWPGDGQRLSSPKFADVFSAQGLSDARGGVIGVFSGVLPGESDTNILAARITARGNRGVDILSHIYSAQKIRTQTQGSGYQYLFYDYTSATLSVTPYSELSGPTPFVLPLQRWTGAFLYDYATARFSQAAYLYREQLQH